MKTFKKVIPYIVALIICVIISIPITSDSIVLDEGYSITLVRGSMSEIVQGAAADEHPPLFHLILKVAEMIGGENLAVYRFVTVLATAINLLWLGATEIRRRWGDKISLFYILLFGLSYSTMERSTVVRMYSWGCLFVTAAVLFLYFYYENRRKKDFVLTVLFTLAAMYTHYYAAMAVFTTWALMFVFVLVKDRKRIKEILFAGILIVLGFAPWLKAFLGQLGRVAEDFWISEFDWEEWRNAPALLMECDLEGLGVAFYVLMLIILVVACMRKNWTALYLAAIMIGTMLLGAAISVWVTPIWQARYPYNVWGVFALAIALVIGEGNELRRLVPQGCAVVLLCIMGYFSTQTLLNSQVLTSTSEEWATFVDENVLEGDCVIADDPGEHRFIYMYYMPQADITMMRSLELKGGKIKLETLMDEYESGNVWYVYDHVQARYGDKKMEKSLGDIGYGMYHKGQFTIQDKILDIYKVEEIHYEE